MMSAPGLERNMLEAVFRAALAATAGKRCVQDQLAAQPLSGPVAVIALGKAASAMALGSASALGADLQRALLITKQGHIPPRLLEDRRFCCLEAGHPLPDKDSLAAGRELLGFIAATPPGEQLLFLISGGTSSLVEVPREGIGLEDLVRLNRWLLGSGLDIAAMNRIRCAVSAIKCGKLLQHLGDRPARVMLLSDVPGDDPAIIGSGLLMPPAGARRLPAGLPDWVRQLADRDDSGCRVTSAQPAVAHHIVARLQDALQAAARQASECGYEATIVDAALHGDAITAGERIAEFLQRQDPGIWLWGGETTVCLPEQPGRGGRNQSLALAAAIALQDHTDCTLLAAGTDGTDGPGDAAGAIIDGGTVARGGGRRAALEALRHADAGSFLDASGDLLVTGPTGTNVMDLVIGLKTPWARIQVN
jgi:hydroxypyruvate reductase